MKLFNHQLSDLYYVEKLLVKHLPRMAEKAQSDELSQAFMDHFEETEIQVERLEEIFELVGRTPRAKTCEAMDGILEEVKDLMDEFKGDPALDAALVLGAQKVEHYEITSYGSLCAFAEELGMNEVCDIIEETLEEEKQTDQKLSQLAMSTLNSEGGQGEEDDEEESQGSRTRGDQDEDDSEDDDSEDDDDTEEEDDSEEGEQSTGRGERRHTMA